MTLIEQLHMPTVMVANQMFKLHKTHGKRVANSCHIEGA